MKNNYSLFIDLKLVLMCSCVKKQNHVPISLISKISVPIENIRKPERLILLDLLRTYILHILNRMEGILNLIENIMVGDMKQNKIM